ncbi:hypothetical protein VB713_11915, partial [Anabaena cylindrica UHCC 0172]|uniref:hypothetical protein n=1 Tax=Anabaena cylindrica TaxID=1165 RepID=UPI002B1EA035
LVHRYYGLTLLYSDDTFLRFSPKCDTSGKRSYRKLSQFSQFTPSLAPDKILPKVRSQIIAISPIFP